MIRNSFVLGAALLISMASINTAKAAHLDMFKCSDTYFNGCIEANKPKPNIVLQKNPYINTYPKNKKGKIVLPKGFALTKAGHAVYFDPQTPVEFRDMVENPTSDRAVAAYIYSAKWREADIKYINQRIQDVGAKLVRERAQKAKAIFRSHAHEIRAIFFMSLFTDGHVKSIGKEIEKAQAAGVDVEIRFVNSSANDYTRLALSGIVPTYKSISNYASAEGLSGVKIGTANAAELNSYHVRSTPSMILVRPGKKKVDYTIVRNITADTVQKRMVQFAQGTQE